MVRSDAIVVWLEDVRKGDIQLVGGKCANLGELTAKGVTVPPGFAVTADAFRRFLEETKIGEVIQKTLTNGEGPRDPKQYEEASEEIRKIIESAPMPSDIASEVRSAYRDLERKTGNSQVKVAVRYSIGRRRDSLTRRFSSAWECRRWLTRKSPGSSLLLTPSMGTHRRSLLN